MGVGDWEVEISKPIDSKKWSFVALFFIQIMAMVNGVLISRQLQEKEALLYCFLFSILKMRCIYEIKQSKRRRQTFSNNEKGAICLNNAYYLITWSVGSYFFSIAMPIQVVFYQKGRGEVRGDQQIAVSSSHFPWPGRFIFSDFQS